MKNCKLIICDVDNTLVKKGEMLSEKTKEVIAACREKGIYFGIASGRPLYQIKGSMDKWGLKDVDVIIGFNGGTIDDYIDNKHHEYYTMKKEDIKECIDLLSAWDTNPTLYRDNKQLFAKEEAYMKDYYAKAGFEYEIVDVEELYSCDAAKIMFRVKAEDMPAIEEHVKAHPSPNYAGFKTQNIMMEFNDARINKGMALKEFAKLHNIDLNDVCAFGDTTNDNEMLEVAGRGVCLINGSDDTKAIADDITEFACNEDGLALYIEKHIL